MSKTPSNWIQLQPLILNMSWHIVDDGDWEPVDVLRL
jgi:hypothetical protein